MACTIPRSERAAVALELDTAVAERTRSDCTRPYSLPHYAFRNPNCELPGSEILHNNQTDLKGSFHPIEPSNISSVPASSVSLFRSPSFGLHLGLGLGLTAKQSATEVLP